MNRDEIKKYLATESAQGILPGLDRIKELCRRLDDPQESLQIIHIAGTNGKGSTGAYLSSILSCVYNKVGWFVSPAVINEKEEILIIKKDSYNSFDFSRKTTELYQSFYLSDEVYEESMTEAIDASEAMVNEGFEKPSAYEIKTAGAFLAFKKEGVDVALVEVGMGGRGDATNIVSKSLLSVITPISMDHMQYLGGSISMIAGEKAGIIKQGGKAVTYQPGVKLESGGGTRADKRKQRIRDRIIATLREEVTVKEAGLFMVDANALSVESMDLNETVFNYKKETYKTRMLGVYQPGNAALAIEAAMRLDIQPDTIKKGIESAVWPARFDVICKDPLTIYDGAHNPDGAMALNKSLKELLPGKKIYGIMGVFKDKAVEEIIRIVLPYLTDVTTVKAPGERGVEAEELKEAFRKINPWVTVEAMGDDVAACVKSVQERAKKDGACVLIFGSLSMAEAVYKSIE